MNYCGFNIESFCSDVCRDHRRPQTLAEICRNIGICCGFRAVAAREKYPGFMLLLIIIKRYWAGSIPGYAPYKSAWFDYILNTLNSLNWILISWLSSFGTNRNTIIKIRLAVLVLAAVLTAGPTVNSGRYNYSISQEICTRFCCALFCCGYAIVHNEFTWSIYPYSSGLLCWHWGNR